MNYVKILKGALEAYLKLLPQYLYREALQVYK
jgi:hypothetical protein